MVYSTELGYDPDEWEECAESYHFLAMSPFTRICLSIGTVMVSVLFFWVLEANKRRHLRKNDGETEQKRQIGAKSTEWEDEEEEETVDSKFARAAEEAALKAQPERRRNSKRELSRKEEAELLAWKAEVQRTAETRLRASEEPDSDAEGRRESSERPEGAAQEADGPQKGTEERQKRQKGGEEAERLAETDQQLIWGRDQQLISGKQTAASDQEQVAFEQLSNRQKQQSLPDQQIQSVQKLPEARTAELLVPMSEWAKTKQLIRVVQQSDDFALSHPGATPPSTPPDGIGQNELAAHYRQMADELTQKLRNELDEMEAEEMDSCQMAEQLQRRHRGDIAEGLECTAASPEMRHRLARQLESHVAIVVAEEMRKRASFSALAGEGTETTAEQLKGEGEREKRKSTDSSGESSEGDFVKVERHEWTAQEKMDHGQSVGTALRNAIQANAAMASGDGGQNGLTPSPQMGGPATEEHEEQVRVSMFEGDGGSTTADEIEYVPAMLGPSKCSADLSPPLNERPKQQPLGAEEAEQMLALLQEYDLSAGEVFIPETDRPTALPEDTAERQKTNRGRQMSSGGVSSSGGVISLPGSTQRTTPAGSSSVPESPDSAGFVNIHPLVGIEVTTASVAEVHEQKEMPGSEMAKELDTQIGVEHAESTEKMEQQQQKQTIFGKEEKTPIKEEEEEQQKGISDELEKQKMRRKEGNADGTAQPSSFIVEEEMLESVADEMAGKGGHGEFTGEAKSERSGKEEVQLLLKSPETAEGGGGSSATMATSRQIGTNEAFDRPADAALLFEDIDDKDVTYAPEIQSLEVPPDQLSQADSLNLVDEEQFSEEHQRVIVTAGEDEMPPKEAEEQRERHEAEKLEEPEAGEAPQRELTPHEEENLQRIIDRLRRTPSPRPHRMGHAQVPQAPQFLRSYFNDESTSSLSSTSIRQSSLLSALGVTSTQEMLLRLTSLEALSDAMRKAGLESSNLIFGIDYTASNKYQGERSFGGQSLHSIDSLRDNPYQTVIKIMGRTLAPFAGHDHGISVFGFGDSATGDWTVFSLNEERDCENLEEVLSVYNRMTPNVDLSGPTNFAPLIYRAMEICQQRRDYHILVIIADGQVTNEKATVKAIVSACQFPLSIIVVGVGDGPWEMMRIFDESLPKRPWDNFHFVELHELINQGADQPIESRELAFAVHSLLEIPDQYATIRKMGLLSSTAFLTRPHSPRRSKSPKAAQKINGTTEGDEGAQEMETKETNC
ncbi:hypothetical protein niasHS_010097 [Heterodera schachtii]|uniref:VWFA domain-containing protein n=1 Tax=Heterodera schachtii TaxID=97005 RepID=A0ABD2J605_HETSC